MNHTTFKTNYSPIIVKLRNWVLLFQFSFFLLAFLNNMITSTQVTMGMGVITCFFISNLVLFILNQYSVSSLVHICIDFFLVNFLLYISGGYQNPLIVLVFIHFLIAPIFLNLMGGIIFGVFGTTCLLILRTTKFTLHYGELNFLNTFEASIILVSLLSLLFAFFIKRYLSELEKTNKKLKTYTSRIDRYRSLGLLASGVCHELGTPLNTILMRTHRLIKSEKNEDLFVIERNTTKCIEALRKLNQQVHTEHEHFYDEVIDISHILHTDVFGLHHDGLNIVLEVPKNQIFVKVPRILLLNSFNEMLANAKDAGADEVRVSLVHRNGHVLIEVSDNGDGFSKEILNSFGIPFNSTKDKGTGLALYHLSNLMVMAGGSLSVDNGKSGGALVKLTLIEVTE